MPSQLLNSSDLCLRLLRHSRCQSKVLSMPWIPMLCKSSYLLASNSVVNMVFYIPLAIGRDNFRLRSIDTISLRSKLMLCIGL
jgi:hypothetical protein